MKPKKLLFLVTLVLLLAPSAALTAADFGWIKDFNARAEADLFAFKARLAARFRIGDVQINTVLSNFERPADAYVALRLGEMSGHPPAVVIEKYRSGKDKGWGALAKSLGIKPGSPEFHALKRSDDLYGASDKSKGGDKDKGKGKGGRGKGKK